MNTEELKKAMNTAYLNTFKVVGNDEAYKEALRVWVKAAADFSSSKLK